MQSIRCPESRSVRSWEVTYTLSAIVFSIGAMAGVLITSYPGIWVQAIIYHQQPCEPRINKLYQKIILCCLYS